MNLEKAYDKNNKNTLWQVVRVFDVAGKLLNDIKSIFVYILTWITAEGGDREQFSIESGIRHECIMSLCLFFMYMGVVRKYLITALRRMGEIFRREERIEGS